MTFPTNEYKRIVLNTERLANDMTDCFSLSYGPDYVLQYTLQPLSLLYHKAYIIQVQPLSLYEFYVLATANLTLNLHNFYTLFSKYALKRMHI